MVPSCHRLDTPRWVFSHSFEYRVSRRSTAGASRSAIGTEPSAASSPAAPRIQAHTQSEANHKSIMVTLFLNVREIVCSVAQSNNVKIKLI